MTVSAAISGDILTMSDSPIRRRIAFDAETWHALNRLSLDSGKRLQNLADEAFRDFLKKHRRPVTLRDALLESVRLHPANDGPPNQRTRRG
jgi:hypothetical protein